jgi:hypothetical protein
MQNFTTIPSSETLTNSLSPLLNNDKTALSNSSGTVFPTTELQVGMKCWRSDQQKLYVLTSASPATWVLLADLSSGSTMVAAAIAATSANDSATLAGQLPSYYTDIPSRLGYTPVNKAGDTATGLQYQIRATGAFNYWGLTAANYLSVGQSSTGDAYVKNAYPGKSLILGAGNTDHIVINSTGAVGAGGANFGTAGQVLTSAGSTAPPVWQAPPQEFASGTRLLFQQTAAPTGWTKDSTHNDKALRVINGTVTSGGSVAFTTAFAQQAVSGTVGATTLTEAQIPSHTHSYSWYQSVSKGSTGTRPIGGNSGTSTATVALNQVDSATGGGGSHNHSFTGTAINLAVQYVDVIIATKN